MKTTLALTLALAAGSATAEDCTGSAFDSAFCDASSPAIGVTEPERQGQAAKEWPQNYNGGHVWLGWGYNPSEALREVNKYQSKYVVTTIPGTPKPEFGTFMEAARYAAEVKLPGVRAYGYDTCNRNTYRTCPDTPFGDDLPVWVYRIDQYGNDWWQYIHAQVGHVPIPDNCPSVGPDVSVVVKADDPPHGEWVAGEWVGERDFIILDYASSDPSPEGIDAAVVSPNIGSLSGPDGWPEHMHELVPEGHMVSGTNNRSEVLRWSDFDEEITNREILSGKVVGKIIRLIPNWMRGRISSYDVETVSEFCFDFERGE